MQLIFRKLADVKREKELAEKRKNEPPLDLAQDHPVRKLISRFRKVSENKGPVTDLEKGSTTTPNNIQNGERPRSGGTRVINVSEGPNQVSTVAPKPAISKWGKFMAGAGGGGGVANVGVKISNDTKQNTDLKLTEGKVQNTAVSIAGGATAPKPAPKPSKWGKLLGNKQETIEETIAEEEENKNYSKEPKSNLKKTDSTDSGILRSDQKLDQIGGEEVAPPGESSTDPTQRESIMSSLGGGSLTAAEQQVISSLYDIKLEIKEEIENLNTKMTKIDEQIGDILKLFSPVSSPFSSQTPSSVSSRLSSCNNSTASNSIVASPKNSLPSSPHKTVEHDPMPITNVDTGRSVTPPSRKSSSGSRSNKSHGSAGRSSPPRPGVSDLPELNFKRKPDKLRRWQGCIDQAPESTPPRQKSPSSGDDEKEHIKDRDLDIL